MRSFFKAILNSDRKQSELSHELVKAALAANRIASEKLTEAVESLIADNNRLRKQSLPCDIAECTKRERM